MKVKLEKTGITGLGLGQCIAAVAFMLPFSVGLQWFLYLVFTGINIFYFIDFSCKRIEVENEN